MNNLSNTHFLGLQYPQNKTIWQVEQYVTDFGALEVVGRKVGYEHLNGKESQSRKKDLVSALFPL